MAVWAWREESGQALVLTVLVTGLLLTTLAIGTTGASLLLSARAALTKATAAAALAAVQQMRATLTLQVDFATYTCTGNGDCSPMPGQTRVTVADGDAFRDLGTTGFGATPEWAVAAGCVGTAWPTVAEPPGTYRICSAQRAVGGRLTIPDTDVLRQVADAWLLANTRGDRELHDVRVTALSVGSAGQVTVHAAADVLSGLPLLGGVAVEQTAWPGTPA